MNYTPPEPANPLEAGLGFKIVNDTVIWFGKAAVRPATPIEVKLWNALIIASAVPAPTMPAEDAIDPFGTPKAES